MPKQLAIIDGHPDPSRERFCHALADAYSEGAVDIGAEVRRVEVAQLDFPLLRTQQDFNQGAGGMPDSLVGPRDAILSADHILIVYPLWHGTMPALFKGFLEQILRPGVAMDYAESKFPKPLLKGKSARIIVTMGMPALAYRWYFGAHSLKSLERSVLRLSGIKPIRESLFGMVEAVSDEKRKRWLARMRETARRDVR